MNSKTSVADSTTSPAERKARRTWTLYPAAAGVRRERPETQVRVSVLAPAYASRRSTSWQAGQKKTPSATSHSGSLAANIKMGRAKPPQSAWGRAVEKVLSKQMALNGRTAAKRRPDSPSTVEKLGRGHSGGEERPSPAKTIDLVSELNRIWDDPSPAADKRLEPPATPKVE